MIVYDMSWASGLSWGLCRKIGPAEGTPIGKREENSYGGHAGHGNWWQSFDPHPFIQTLPPSKPPKLITDTVFFDDNLMKIQKNIVGRKSTPRFIMERGIPEMNQVIGPKEEGWEIVPSPFQRTVPMDQQVDSKKDHSEFASAVVGTSEEPHPLVKSLKTTASQAGVEQRTSASQYSKMDKEKETQYEKDMRDKGVQFKNETGDKETQYEKDVKEKGMQSGGVPVVRGISWKGAFPNTTFHAVAYPAVQPIKKERPRRLEEMVHVGPTGMDIDLPIYVEPKREGYFMANPIPTERPTVGLRRSDLIPNVLVKREFPNEPIPLFKPSKKRKLHDRANELLRMESSIPTRRHSDVQVGKRGERRGSASGRLPSGKMMPKRVRASAGLTVNTDVPRINYVKKRGKYAQRNPKTPPLLTETHYGKSMDKNIPNPSSRRGAAKTAKQKIASQAKVGKRRST